MALYPAELPWLAKPAAVELSLSLIVASALNQRGLVGYLDLSSHGDDEVGEAGEPFWSAPQAQSGPWQVDLAERFGSFLAGALDAPEDNLERGLSFLTASRASLTVGTFIFVVSDFTGELAPEPWQRAVELGWDVIPVIVQDPVWEQSFPDVGGVLLPLTDAGGKRAAHVRLDAREIAERRHAHEARLEELRNNFLGLGLDTVLIGEADRHAIHAAFLIWADARSAIGRR
jgi:hypothetical protein